VGQSSEQDEQFQTMLIKVGSFISLQKDDIKKLKDDLKKTQDNVGELKTDKDNLLRLL
jgi:3-methyladenine DNA glycosylase AlkD